MLQIFKKIDFQLMCLVLALFQASITESSASLSDRTDIFFAEVAKDVNDINYDELVALIRKGIDLADTRKFKTPLLWAVSELKNNSNGEQVVKVLIDQILKTNESLLYSKDADGNTALSIAAQLRKHVFYDLLYRVYTMEQQEFINKKGLSALHYKNLTDRTNRFFRIIAKKIMLLNEQISNELKELIQKKIEFNYHFGEFQETPLTLSVKNLPDNALGIEIVEALLNNGAYYDSTNFAGTSALSIAIQENKPTFAQLLIRFGANPNMTDTNGKTPKDYALESNHETIQNLFSKKNKEKESPADTSKHSTQQNDTPIEQKIILNDQKEILAIEYFGFNSDDLTKSDLVKLRANYKKKALSLHPDKNKSPDAESKFKELQGYYDNLNPLLKKYNIIS